MSLLERLQALAGLPEAASEFGTGQGQRAQHAAWFLSPLQAAGMQDLEPAEAQSLWLLDLLEATGLEFQGEEDATFAQLQPQPGLPLALLHLREAEPWLLYAWGEAKEIQRLHQLLAQAAPLHLHKLGHGLLLQTAQTWFEITQLSYAFASQEQRLMGQAQGRLVPALLGVLSQELQAQFHLESIAGRPREMGLGEMQLQETGLVQGFDLRLSEFIKALEPLTQALESRRNLLTQQHLLRWEPGPGGLTPLGRPLELRLRERVTQPELLLKQLTKGGKPWDLLGNYQRYSSQLWRAFVTDEQGHSLELELEGQNLRLFFEDNTSLALFERVEQLLSRQWGLTELA